MKRIVTAIVLVALVILLVLLVLSSVSPRSQRAATEQRTSVRARARRPRDRVSRRSRVAGLSPVARTFTDQGGRELVVRMLDVGQGDATYIRNGESRVLIDGGPDDATLGRYLDSLNLNNTTIDVVVLSHQHYDHYNGLFALFESARNIKVRYFFENRDPATARTLARLRDSVIARTGRDGLIYRDTDDPCANGAPLCTITLTGGAKLRLISPLPASNNSNNRSTAVKLVGPDSASFTMWLAGDAERDEIGYFESVGYQNNPGMRADVLKANHHGSCNGVSARYLQLLRPSLTIASLAALNDYGHMHEQAKSTYSKADVPWYRTDQNGTVTIRSPGTRGGGYSVSVERGARNMSGPSDRPSGQPACAGM